LKYYLPFRLGYLCLLAYYEAFKVAVLIETYYYQCNQIRKWKKNRFQGISVPIRRNLKKSWSDTQIRFYKAAFPPSSLYKSDKMIGKCIEVAEMQFLRSVKG
jgi:hypothetical protein